MYYYMYYCDMLLTQQQLPVMYKICCAFFVIQ